ncbi:MAG TPA: SRPBCC family protein [Bryobacteraceae bacterium]|nr:SRPBCC family protein [Bryobacteraceae bacterium]
MQEPSVVHNTFVIERSYPKPPARVFAAFADPAQKRRWFAEGEGHSVEEFHSDFRAGGAERMRYCFKEGTPFPGVALINEGTYQDIVPNRRVVLASTMTLGDRRISASLVTIELLAADHGTDLICTHQGAFFEGSDGPQRREEGWRTLLDRLTGELTR